MNTELKDKIEKIIGYIDSDSDRDFMLANAAVLLRAALKPKREFQNRRLTVKMVEEIKENIIQVGFIAYEYIRVDKLAKILDVKL